MLAPRLEPSKNLPTAGEESKHDARSIPEWASSLADLRFPSAQELKHASVDLLHKVFMWNQGKLLSVIQGEVLVYFGMCSVGQADFSRMLEQRSAQVPVATFLQRRRSEAQLFGLMELSRYALDFAQDVSRQTGPGGIILFDMGGRTQNGGWSSNHRIRTSPRAMLAGDPDSLREHCLEPHKSCRTAGVCASRQGYSAERFNAELLIALPWEDFRRFDYQVRDIQAPALGALTAQDYEEVYESRDRREMGQRYAQQLLLQQALRASLGRHTS